MEGMNGIDVLKLVKKMNPSTDFIFLIELMRSTLIDPFLYFWITPAGESKFPVIILWLLGLGYGSFLAWIAWLYIDDSN